MDRHTAIPTVGHWRQGRHREDLEVKLFACESRSTLSTMNTRLGGLQKKVSKYIDNVWNKWKEGLPLDKVGLHEHLDTLQSAQKQTVNTSIAARKHDIRHQLRHHRKHRHRW